MPPSLLAAGAGATGNQSRGLARRGPGPLRLPTERAGESPACRVPGSGLHYPILAATVAASCWLRSAFTWVTSARDWPSGTWAATVEVLLRCEKRLRRVEALRPVLLRRVDGRA